MCLPDTGWKIADMVVNENMEKVREYQIMSVPTVVLEGKTVCHCPGFLSLSKGARTTFNGELL